MSALEGAARPSLGGPQSLFYSDTATDQLPRIVRGEGVYLWDAGGRRYLDVASGAFLANLGQGSERVLSAIVEQGRKLSFSYVRTTLHDANIDFADRVARLAGPGFERVHLSSGGSEANEMAIKFLRQYECAHGRTSKTRLITCMPSYHGATLATIAMNGDHDAESVYGAMTPFSSKIPAPLTYRAESPEAAAQASAAALEATILRLGPENVLAFVVEPVGGQSTGANVPDPLFFREVRRICDAHGVYLVYDEVISAVRCGRFLAAHLYDDARPDLVVLAKGLGAGYAPLGAVVMPARMVDELAASTGFNLSHTYNANPIACAAGCAVVDEIIDRDLIGNAERTGAYLRARLEELAERSPIVGDVRGRGLIHGLELVTSKETKQIPAPHLNAADRLRVHGAESGLLLYSRRQNGGRYGEWTIASPPLIITESQCDELVEGLESALSRLTDELLAAGALS